MLKQDHPRLALDVRELRLLQVRRLDETVADHVARLVVSPDDRDTAALDRVARESIDDIVQPENWIAVRRAHRTVDRVEQIVREDAVGGGPL